MINVYDINLTIEQFMVIWSISAIGWIGLLGGLYNIFMNKVVVPALRS